MTKKGKGKVEKGDLLREIQRLAVIALVSDDDLMERLVLKGGNAIDLVHSISFRGSADVDFSMSGDFDGEKLDAYKARMDTLLSETFQENGYEVFDVTLRQRPPDITEDISDFWGGYQLEFRLVPTELYEEWKDNIAELRRRALNLGLGTRFIVDISKFEYTEGKQKADLAGYQIYVYSPQMLVLEKIRAICQQLPEYGPVVKRSRRGASRARDFVDIHWLATKYTPDLVSPECWSVLSAVFAAKKVPLSLLAQIDSQREFHRQSFPAVKDAVKAGITLKEFDFYFDYVVSLVNNLEARGNV